MVWSPAELGRRTSPPTVTGEPEDSEDASWLGRESLPVEVQPLRNTAAHAKRIWIFNDIASPPQFGDTGCQSLAEISAVLNGSGPKFSNRGYSAAHYE